MTLSMLVVVHFVQFMKLFLQINAAWLAVQEPRLKQHKLVINMQMHGSKVSRIAVKPLFMVFDVFFNVLVNARNGNKFLMLLFNDHMMMILMRKTLIILNLHQDEKNYFSPNRFYCVETACAPCGIVLAWTKFAKSESPTNILNWLGELFPNRDDQPSYICIDKACQVFKTAVGNRNWKDWTDTTHFIVDTYHYNNHRATDAICWKWCNPAPQDGSAPNLVGERIDENGNLIQFREFNTQVCEQLNAWLAGYQSTLKRMTSKTFNWFIHTMLVYHVKYVLTKLKDDELTDEESGDDEESSSSSESDDSDEEYDSTSSSDNDMHVSD